MPLTAGSADILATPFAPTVTQNALGAGAAISYQVAAVNAAGQDSMPSPATITPANNVSPNPNNTLTWTLQPGQVQTRILKNGALLATAGAGINTFNDNAGLSTITYTSQTNNPAYATYVTNSPLDGGKATYACAIPGLPPAASPTDIFAISGSATKVIKVTRIVVSATQTTAGMVDIYIIKRTSGTQSAGVNQASNLVSYDSNNQTATATVYEYTTNPASLGTGANTVFVEKLFVPAASTVASPDKMELRFGDRPAQAMTLRGVSQFLCVNLNAVSVSGGQFDFVCEWSEE